MCWHPNLEVVLKNYKTDQRTQSKPEPIEFQRWYIHAPEKSSGMAGQAVRFDGVWRSVR
jgi:hypothetical protein